MADWLPPTRYWVLAIFIASALYAHFRGRVRFKLARALTDFTVLISPINAVMYLFSRAPATPYLKTSAFPELSLLRDNWQVIREEALKLNDEGYIKAASGYNDIGFNSFFRTGWKRFYLKWYDRDMASANALCPKTVALLKQIPGVKAAMFASLPPGAKLVRHRDPYAGSLRYHLGLTTPNDPGCYIDVDGEKYHWKDGEDVIILPSVNDEAAAGMFPKGWKTLKPYLRIVEQPKDRETAGVERGLGDQVPGIRFNPFRVGEWGWNLYQGSTLRCVL